MFNLLTNYEFNSVMHIHEHACTPYMRDECLHYHYTMYCVHV